MRDMIDLQKKKKKNENNMDAIMTMLDIFVF